MAGLDDFKLLDEWYKAMIAAGAVLAVPAITTDHKPALFCALGLILFGGGEFINHPFQTRLLYNEGGGLAGKASGRVRSPKVVGLLLDAIGVALFGWGLWLLLLR